MAGAGWQWVVKTKMWAIGIFATGQVPHNQVRIAIANATETGVSPSDALVLEPRT
ncbi:MAG: hypothetical protein AAGH67_06065 [Cyanobacteria bacterium P01_H01_bin.162]